MTDKDDLAAPGVGARGASRLEPEAEVPFSFAGGARRPQPAAGDFWRWALGDLRMSTTRRFLAEFLVAQAVRSAAPHRLEWASFDVLAENHTRIEVESCAYLQRFATQRETDPVFAFSSAYATRMLDEALGTYVDVDPRDRVDVWVFALENCRDRELYNPLATDQWEFRVVPHRRLLASAKKRGDLSFFDGLGISPVAWEALSDGVAEARAQNDEM